jgi:phosphate transport system permease protein
MPSTLDTVVDRAVERPRARTRVTALSAIGEPYQWLLAGALALGMAMIVGFLLMVLWNGAAAFWPKPIEVVTLADGGVIAGEPTRSEEFRLGADRLAALDEATRRRIRADGGFAWRTLYRTGNFDFYNDDFRWVADFEARSVATPADLYFVERLEWGAFVGRIVSLDLAGTRAAVDDPRAHAAHEEARRRWRTIRAIEQDEIGHVNARIERERLRVRRVAIDEGAQSEAHATASREAEARIASLRRDYDRLAAEAQRLKAEDERFKVTLAEIGGREKTLKLSDIVRFYPANAIGPVERLGVYLSRWGEFLTDSPREANTEGGVWPAIFGTFAMTLLMVIAVAPFGVVTALYLREYARQGRLVAIVRISVNNLAGVPSIVYGVFGLGFFAYTLGASIDQLFYPERLPSPTFGTGGLLWSSLTLALLTVPVVIVATEEALAAVPRSMREGSLACGASKWQTIKYIVLPRAMPGIMTGLILAMARGAGEVAPLMLVGVVKLAPELPIDGVFPYLHLERSFMHLGFHIYDVGFQSRNSEAGKPMVFVTTLLLIALIAAMNAAAIVIRNRLKRRFAGSQF